ncbi:MAG: hypothetical protein Unbinned8472contig1000_30 [Prokaryotic dsDNA virus sp.]|nr:MAG: hypothetical protein Unbinned8472contig1000_30 [Prokaryotic dsDNA virus sp.]|tara:strand:- start:3198 stop:3359 length:162 start_codon:yes stop_codon:yes gene_type:complete
MSRTGESKDPFMGVYEIKYEGEEPYTVEIKDLAGLNKLARARKRLGFKMEKVK